MLINRKNRGFTLVEIMIVVAIIALLAAIAVPGFLRARKRAQGTTIKNDLRLIDAAKDQYAIEYNKTTMTPLATDLTPYFKSNSRLATVVGANLQDIFGGNYTIQDLNTLPSIDAGTKAGLSDVCDANFFSPFQ